MCKKIFFFATFALFVESCNVPYDGDERYLFETTVVDSNNNPIINKEVSVYFYNGDYYDNDSNFIFGERAFDNIISGNTDANGTIKLAFPFASNRENLVIKIGKESSGFLRGEFELINIKKQNFTNYKLLEPKIIIYNFDEVVNLNVNVLNSNSSKYISKLEFLGIEKKSVKNFNIIESNAMAIPVTSSLYIPLKNQNATIKYEITEIINGQLLKSIVEEPISIIDVNLTYTITL